MGRYSCKKYSATSDWPGGIGCHRLTEKPDNNLLVQEGGFVQVIASEHNANNTVLECAKLARGIAQSNSIPTQLLISLHVHAEPFPDSPVLKAYQMSQSAP
jgi:hypothetical protein